MAASFLLLILALGFCSKAQADGMTLWSSKNCIACHGATPAGPRFNAANAVNVINHAIANNYGGQMGAQAGVTLAERSQIAAYIASFVPDPNPANLAVPYNSSGKTFTIPNIVLNTGTFTSIVTVSSPSKGTVSYNGLTATYTPTPGQFGTDSFTYNASGPAGTSSIRTVTLVIASPPPPVSGWWWNPDEGGRGFAIEQQGNNMFMAAFLYDPAGRATWYAAGPTAMTGSAFTSTLTTYLGGQTLTGTYHPTTGTINSGDISIVFTDTTHGTLTWPGGTVPIQRFDIVPGGAASTPPAGTPEAGWWWNAAEGGRGYAIEIQNGSMFLAGFMYDNFGNPIWYVSGPAPMTNTTTYQGTWQQYGNGQTLTGAYKPASVVNANVGNITVQFSSTTTATLTLPDGRQIPLTRFQY